MSETKQIGRSEQIVRLSDELLALLHTVPIFASLDGDKLHCLDGTRLLYLETSDVLVHQGDMVRFFWILLAGSMRASQAMADGREMPLHTLTQGFAFGEVPLLANMPHSVTLSASEPCQLLELDEEQFWSLMTSCPEVRRAILGNMAYRLQKIQSSTLHQEKMASLGTLAAGLMHELNNPGAAARRAASQLRSNLTRMHHLGAKWTRIKLTEEQKQCIYDLQTQALATDHPKRMNSVEQMDAEEKLAEWMESAKVENAWKLAPTLVSVDIDTKELECARRCFDESDFSDALSWVEAMISSQQLVATIEESIGRVSDLVHAVKTYAYEGKGQRQTVDVNDSIHATLVILGHKLREKEVQLEKHFAADLPVMHTECSGLNQIWTNLLDNAIDAVEQHGTIAVKTWPEKTQDKAGKEQVDLCISVRDNGSGIPLESQSQIFDSFYTTKPVGVGTGLGLGIVQRIVEQYGGVIRFSSEPGATEFVVRLPSERP
ncbi:cyclic nucleotide-binding domain-containing protein [Granulicella sp. WH15]|uniref:sensor histidine kinase n=1 Tax=Granulicella sp. WH15 TaxID=2602070 RepID=UPI001366D30D|nr:ATP-binding protein [Granulicella sp. WH15]QHN02855.1 cyclic nucleotide-binding domain-containing protein [Granulicella sp. WH15]